MKECRFLILGIGLTFLSALTAGELPTYMLGTPRVPILRNATSDSAATEWAKRNAMVSPIAIAHVQTAKGFSRDDNISGNGWYAKAAVGGFPFERNRPQYYLGDKLLAPANVDWVATYELFKTLPGRENFLFDTVGRRVYVVLGTTSVFKWVVAENNSLTTNDVVIIAVPVSSERPKNVFWTDSGQDGTPIDLTGKFVGLYGPSNLLTQVTAQQKTGVVVGGTETYQTTVTNGIYIDSQSSKSSLYAAGRLEGTFVLAYYDSGDHTKLVDVITVRVSNKEPSVRQVSVGGILTPDGKGYSGTGLVPMPKQEALTEQQNGDSFGPYLYQHSGTYSYSPKNKSVFALRPTDEKTRNMTRTIWYETDNQGVQWPYEVDEYLVSWPTNEMAVIVRGEDPKRPGLGVKIPSDYTAELQKFQENADGSDPRSNPHAKAPSDGYFTPVAAGFSLLKLTGDDNVWFVPFRSILRTDESVYNLSFVATVPVGLEIGFRGGIGDDLATNMVTDVAASGFAIASDIPGYIYEPASDKVWNPDIYSESGVLDNGVTSSVYAVTAPMDDAATNRIEVWWSTKYQQSDMPSALSVPSLPQHWNIRWPKATEAPTIALASQAGGANLSFWGQGQAVCFASENTRVPIPARSFFSQDGGTILFWTRDYEQEMTTWNRDNLGAGALLTLGDTNGVSLVTVDYDAAKGFVVGFCGTTLQTKCVPAAHEWHLFKLSWSNDCVSCSVFDSRWWEGAIDEVTGAVSAEGRAKLAACLFGCSLGARPSTKTPSWYYRCMDDVIFVKEPLDVNLETMNRLLSDDMTDDTDITFVYTFDDSDELISDGTSEDLRLIRDHKIGVTENVGGCYSVSPGAPHLGYSILSSETTPVVYRQTNAGACGYNPNEEHAFVEAEQGGYVAWAMRCDLNQRIMNYDPVSKPGVLVSYVQGNKAKMQFYHVAVTNIFYPDFGATCTVGNQLPGPHPFDRFETPWLSKTTWTDPNAEPPFRDRKGQVWARAAGALDMLMYYQQQSTFDWPKGLATPTLGAQVPWLAYADATNTASVLSTPKPWHWDVEWPTTAVPTMKIGYTLTTAEYDLPEVWSAKSMAVLYPVTNADKIALLTDPTVARRVALGFKASTQLASAGLKTGPGEKLEEKKGMYYFRGITATLSDRLYIDPTTDELVLIGKKESKAAGINLLLPNVITAEEVAGVKALLTTEGDVRNKLITALHGLQGLGVVKPTTVTKGTRNGYSEYRDVYDAPDHYALTAIGTGGRGATNWVVLIENNATNSFCDAGNPINMRLLKIVPEYYGGSVVTREDPNNLLSQVLSIHYSQGFCGKADDFEFQWQKAAPSTMNWLDARQDFGLTSFSVGLQGDTLANMVNTYWKCRYRAKSGTTAYDTMGDAWSEWSDKGLAEGWVQRCLNNITPFTQRMTDLYNNAAETSVTMMRQAGKPYTGDVALNQDNLTSVGLVELYRTILNKAETMSVMQGPTTAEANKQLLLAVERLADLYNALGDEAYADAINPTIGFGSNFTEIETGLTIDYGAASSSLFCFDNQVSSLLDEELALVRGRDCLDNPDGHTAPYFNRLVWNFTKGITAGEVAYAVNYGISGHRSSTMTAETAAEQYPQGHGDAYGHYLSALKGYYRLLRNPNFSWGVPGMSEMNVADSVVNVDYYDEATFATSAANVAKAAEKAVELTALKAWRDNNADTVGAGYLDSNATNAFGYGEWASRGAYGALCNWAVANSLLPEAKSTDDSGVAYSDKGLTRIDRSTVTGIAALSEAVASIESTCDRMDSGKNPLGLDANAVPFDLTPIGDASDATHFEQIRARAGKAFDNARKILDRAQTYANRLKLIQETEAGAIDNLDYMEDDFTAQLIAIYGRPYEQDIGSSGTYAQGYYGPDTYHYMWMDLSKYGLTDVSDTMVVTTVTYKIDSSMTGAYDSSSRKETKGLTVRYDLSASGLVQRDATITGERPASGELQQAYSDLLTAYVSARNAISAMNRSKDHMDKTEKLVLRNMKALSDRQNAVTGKYSDLISYGKSLNAAKISEANFQTAMDNLNIGKVDSSVIGCVGLATTILADGSKVAAAGVCGILYFAASLARDAAQIAASEYERKIDQLNVEIQKAENAYDKCGQEVEGWSEMLDAVDAHAEAVMAATEAVSALNAAQEPITKLLQDARAIEETRELTRQQYVNNIAKLRYNDMFFRKLRNAALTQYDTAFALAQKYTLLAAKAYAYETGSPLESTETGRAFLRSIVGARALGEVDNDGLPMVSESGDAGLSGILAKLDANWANLKTQLGINNPQTYQNWFSLRHGLFRILPNSLGDDAWAKELSKYWVEDVRDNAEFAHHCQPFASQFGLAEKEPGLVIPFETTIDFAYNLFGKPLAFNDAQFESTWYATKISKVGVWFEGYNERNDGATQGVGAFTTTPYVYLVPVGTDRMRVPGTENNDEIVGFNVVDQTIPVPYPLTDAEIAESNWLPTYSGETAGADSETRLRRHPAFRAYYGNSGTAPSDSALDATRLVGRSVWNTKWILVIPAGALNADRDQALKSFIYGLDTDRDGVIDVKPVSDIKIGFKTYSHGGK